MLVLPLPIYISIVYHIRVCVLCHHTTESASSAAMNVTRVRIVWIEIMSKILSRACVSRFASPFGRISSASSRETINTKLRSPTCVIFSFFFLALDPDSVYVKIQINRTSQLWRARARARISNGKQGVRNGSINKTNIIFLIKWNANIRQGGWVGQRWEC